MDWAAQRRFTIFGIIGVIIIGILGVVSYATLHQAPSCSDGVQNENEDGIDCGGPCPYLCTEQERVPTVLFAQAIPKDGNRADVAASIENGNAAAAAKDVAYTVTLYGADQSLIGQVSGTIDLPPAATMPLYLPNITTGGQSVIHAFLTIATSSLQWFSQVGDPRLLPIVSNTTLSGATSSPRIDATLSNGSVTPITNVPVIVFVKDSQNNVIAASQTLVPVIPAQGQATATFTWNTAFSGNPATIEVTPVIPLP